MANQELTYKDIQVLNGRDAVVAFFTMLGYETSVRVEQSPAALGITADSLVSQIRRIELIANQEDLLYVYLVELASVTLTVTRGIARAFRSRAGNYFLVLADDYDSIDFVLLDKSPPLPTAPSALAQKQVALRPRSLSVNRRNPDRLHLRVLRRFAYTEPDPVAQYQKLCSAYTLAEWSEDFFNNRALFSDYFLKERLPTDYAEWREDPRSIFREFQALYSQPSAHWSGKSRSEFQEELLVPVFRLLGYTVVPGKGEGAQNPEPDYRLYAPDSRTLLALCLIYPWNRSLDGKDDKDPDRSEENPAAVVVSILQRGKTDWAIVTNGKLWRLYSARTHSRATNYYEIDLEEVMAEQGTLAEDPSTAFRYFWLCFRRNAMEPPASFLERLLQGSEEYAKTLGARLKERVFEQIFPYFAEGFIESIRHAEGRVSDLPQERLDQIFQGTLTFLYRLLFLLYAEARDLLPIKETRGYWEKSLTRLKREVAEIAGKLYGEDEVRLKAAYRTDSTALYDRLTDLSRIIDQGEAAINVPVYNGGLFLTVPDQDDTSPEAESARFLVAHKIPDRYLALGLDRLARDVDEKTHALVFIDYKSLGVRQLGSIYEGLLEFTLRVAQEKMAVVKGKRTEEIVPYRESADKKLKILIEGRGKDAKERIYAKGKVYLENDRRERKATGSYYTPDDIVRHIVRHTVGPVLEDKFERVRLHLRQAQKLYREAIQAKKEFERRRMTPPDPEQRAIRALQEKFRINVMDELFDLKVLDPAMGSGHFLVEAVDFITDRVVDFLNAFPWNPVLVELKQTRNTILREMDERGISIDASRLTDVNLLKRQVLKRCMYGVDLNPMSVELAKVSLWLDCFTLGAPLSFIDHHLRCGNSLVGVSVKEVQEALYETQMNLFGSRFAGLLLATDLMRHIAELSDVTSAQVRESRAEYWRALNALAPFKRILDLYTSHWFGNSREKKRRWKQETRSDPPVLAFLKSSEAEPFINARDEKALRQVVEAQPPNDRCTAETALRAAAKEHFFHWDLEYPEVFYGPRPGTRQKIERLEHGGFDVVIGNPPFVDKKHIVNHLSALDAFWQECGHFRTAKGIYDVYMLFLEQAARLCRTGGRLGLLSPIPWLAQSEGAELRSRLMELGSIEILNFSTHSHFPDALVKVVAVVLHRGIVSRSLTIWDADGKRTLPEQILSKVFNGQFRVDVPPEYIPILEKIYSHSVPLATLYKPTFGLRALSKEAGKFTKDFLIRPKQQCMHPVPYVEAKDLKGRRVCWTGKWLDYQPHLMYNPRSPDLFLSPKVLVPSLLSKRKIHAVYDDEGYFVDQSLVCISATYELPKLSQNVRRPSLRAVTLQLNSATVSFYFAHAVVSEALGGGAIHATPGLVGKLPIFTQPELGDVMTDNADEVIGTICRFTDHERKTIMRWYASVEGLKDV